MKSLAFLISLCMIHIVISEWQGLISLDTSDKPYVFQTTYVDPLSGRSHIVFSVEKDDLFSWYYTYIEKDGQTAPPYLLSNHIASNSLFSASLTGDNDASTIYMLSGLKRGTHDDVYFRESASNGGSWSRPILARANNHDDNEERTIPSIIHLFSDRLFAFYKKSGVLTFTTRAPESTVWVNESPINIPLCTTLKDTLTISAATVNLTGKANAVAFFLICIRNDKAIPVIGESVDNGLTWRFSTKEFNAGAMFHSTAFTSDYKTSKFYGAFLEEDPDSGWPRSTVFEYSLGGNWDIIGSFPTQRYIIQSLQFCKLMNGYHLIHLASESTVWRYTAVLKQIPLIESHNENSLPKLDFGPCSSNALISCGEENILATGAGECGKQVLYGRRFKFR